MRADPGVNDLLDLDAGAAAARLAALSDADIANHLRTLAPDNAHALALRAQCAERAGQTEQALDLSKRAFAAYPGSPRITLGHARILQAAGACGELATLQERLPQLVSASPGQATLAPCASKPPR